MRERAARHRRRARRARRRRCRRTSSPKAARSSRWLADNHFTFLGYRCHDLVERRRRRTRCASSRARASASCARAGEATCRDELRRAAAGGARATRACPSCWSSPRRTRARPCIGRATSTTSASSASTPTGNVCGEHRFLGLYTSTAYSAQPGRHSAAAAQGRQRDRARGRSRRAATPARRCSTSSRPIRATSCSRSSEDELLRTAIGILHLGERQRFRLFVRRDPFERFLSCLIYAPRENYTTELRAEVAGDPDRRRSTARARSSTCTCRSRCWRAS